VGETVTARWQHYLVSLWRAMIGMRMTVKTGQLLQDGGAPEYVYHDRTAWRWQQRISTKKCCPCTVNIACHVKQSSKTTSFGRTLSWQWRGGMSSVRVVETATTRILWRRFPGTCEMLGQVFKFVWRLHWKTNAVCMSFSPFVSFKSRFVTYLLNFPRSLNLCLPVTNKTATTTNTK